MRDLLRLALPLALAALAAGCRFEEPIQLPPARIHATPSGVHYVDVLPGEGAPVRAGDEVELHYVGRVSGGAVFDDSRDRGEPLRFVLGSNTVLPAWEEALEGMRPGGIRELTIPPRLAYGDEGLGDVIPPDATLVLEVELLAATPAGEPESHP